MSEEADFIGIGWSFPPEFSEQGVSMVSDIEDIEGSLQILFSTRVGERFLQPEYGSALDELIFDPLNLSITQVKNLVEEAITTFEPRIVLDDVTITPRESEGLLEIEIEYLISNTNSRHNFVYPFYLNEGV